MHCTDFGPKAADKTQKGSKLSGGLWVACSREVVGLLEGEAHTRERDTAVTPGGVAWHEMLTHTTRPCP